MMVIFISQCEKNALKKTRRILDCFAERIGDNAWRTVITEDGVSTVRKLLRQSASKSTAIACHWLRSRSRSQLLWIVGNKNKFDNVGNIPVNKTQKSIFQIENNWHFLPLIKSLSALAALFHDWGKATALFQEKLNNASKEQINKGDPIRHEWISCLLLNALVKMSEHLDDDTHWLMKIESGELNEKHLEDAVKQQEGKPLSQLPPAAKLISWLIVSHHRLPCPKNAKDWRGEFAPTLDSISKWMTYDWGYKNESFENHEIYKIRLDACFQFPYGLLSQSSVWLKQLGKWAHRLREELPNLICCIENESYRLLLHHARLCLMLGDHYYSSQKADINWQGNVKLFANTDKQTKLLKQYLDEHLVGVSNSALNISHLLPAFEQELPIVQNVRALEKSSPSEFKWQDKAVEKIKSWREQENKDVSGFFVVNMASTGCGKTFANAKVMKALSHDEDRLRYILALGLRTLTLQTGEEYRERIGLDNSELAVLIGSKAILDLHNQNLNNDKLLEEEQIGSESLESLLEEDIDYDCDIPEERLATVLTKQRDRQFLYAPVLACTIDHIIAATETKKGGRYILPSLRLMSSDLVIDEVDDFYGSDLIAIGRLIHLAGMLGRKVMISSATIPPDLAEGYFNAYQAGRHLFSLTRNVNNKIGCVWIDEFKTTIKTIDSQQSQNLIEMYRETHESFISKRVEKLNQQLPRRKASIVECQDIIDDGECDGDETKQTKYFEKIKQAILEKHQNHNTTDIKTGIKVSFGVVRIANIKPCVSLARHLIESDWPNEIDAKIMAYHSQQILLLRHEQEKHLDHVLKRKEKSEDPPTAFTNSVIRHHLDRSKVQHVLFILIATPVEEIGRDHDFDWALIEPSSYRSIIQLSGRVRRHREGKINQPNVALMQYNWRTVKNGNRPNEKYFNHPGYEETLVLQTHDLCKLIDIESVTQSINAIPRIQKPKQLNERNSLSDLEHFVTKNQLTSYKDYGPEKLQGYVKEAWYLTALPQVLNPFRQGEPSTKLFLMYEPEKEACTFIEKVEQGEPVNREGILGIQYDSIKAEHKERLWLSRDYIELLESYSKKLDRSKKKISLQYGELSFIHRPDQKYKYSDQFGLVED